MSDVLGGVRPLRLPRCETHHASCDCREAMILQGVEWIAREIMEFDRKYVDSPMSASEHLNSALKMAVDLRNRMRSGPDDIAAAQLERDAKEFTW